VPAEVVLRALGNVWQTLTPLDVPMAVMGGIALSVWKHVRATRDVDLLLAVEQSHVDRLLVQLRAAQILPKRDPPVTSLGQLQVVQLLYEPPEALMPVQIDLLLASGEYHEKALERRVFIRLPGLDTEIAVLTCEDMILHKLLAGRIIDRADVAALLRWNRPSLQWDYLQQWASALELTTDLTEVCREAFPGEALPRSGL
jgi:hypothetical protein